MAHTLLEQQFVVLQKDSKQTPINFLVDILGLNKKLKSHDTYYAYPNNNLNFGFYGNYDKELDHYNTTPALIFVDKTNAEKNKIYGSLCIGSIFYHISEGETVKYFKYVCENSQSYTYILAQDENGEWVVFNGDKMYSDYGVAGIYNNPQIGHAEIVDSGNQFIFAQACRLDTGVKFKELFFVLSAKSYTDTNCIVQHGDKFYRLVSVSNVKDEAGRFPAFAFPVSD